jgi:hypothetical protein
MHPPSHPRKGAIPGHGEIDLDRAVEKLYVTDWQGDRGVVVEAHAWPTEVLGLDAAPDRQFSQCHQEVVPDCAM